MQAITTKYLPPTTYKEERIKAYYAGGSITVSYEYGASNDTAMCESEANARKAAQKLADQLNWGPIVAGGSLPDGATHHWAFMFHTY